MPILQLNGLFRILCEIIEIQNFLVYKATKINILLGFIMQIGNLGYEN